VRRKRSEIGHDYGEHFNPWESIGGNLIHYYNAKNYRSMSIRILCLGEYVKAKGMRKSSILGDYPVGGWKINGVRQTTMLENITCKECLRKALPIFRKRSSKFLIKIEQAIGEL